MDKETYKAIDRSIRKLRGDISDDIFIMECEHIERRELPATINVYIGQKKRVLLCNVCATQIYSLTRAAKYEAQIKEISKKIEEINEEIDKKIKAQSTRKWYQKLWSK